MTARLSGDLALASACASGDEAAWEEFGRAYFGFIRAFAARLLPDATAADLADQVIADLWQRGKIARFEGRSSLKTWLAAVVAHAAANARERDRRLVPLDSGNRHGAAPAVEPPDTGLSGRRRLAEFLTEAMARLPSRDRLLLLFYYEQELTLEQIGPLMRRSKAALSRRLKRIVTAVREELDKRAGEHFGASARDLAGDLESVELDLGALLTTQQDHLGPVEEKGERA